MPQFYVNFIRKRSRVFWQTVAVFGVVGFTALTGVAQQLERVDFKHIAAKIAIDESQKMVKGSLSVSFQVLQNLDSLYLDGKGMAITAVKEGPMEVSADGNKIWFHSQFMAGKTYSVSFDYQVVPTQAFYFWPVGAHRDYGEIWTQGQGKYTSHWLPSIDDTNDKIVFELSIVAPSNKVVIANGKLISENLLGNQKVWHYAMENPMSSYLVALAIGDFNSRKEISDSGIPLLNYFRPDDADKVAFTYCNSKAIFDFLETEIGVPYPWQNYKQVPLRDFLYAGMENTGATFFSRAFMVDSIGHNDRNYSNVNAHELAHQWFGNLVTAKSGEDHWLQEGFATYYALLAERNLYGEDYFYWQLLQSAEQLTAMSDEGKGESLLDPRASSLTFYQKGAWALHILREKIGEESFRAAVKNYLEKYSFKNVSTQEFLAEVRSVSQTDLSEFEKDWLQQTAFQSEEAYLSLKKSPLIVKYFTIAALRPLPLAEKAKQLEEVLKLSNEFLGQEAVFQLGQEPAAEELDLYKLAFQSKNLYIRQALAQMVSPVPQGLQKEYEGLLKDDSYLTIETALFQLWSQYPEKRAVYLDATRGISGFQNKNVEQLWLALSLLTEDYHVDAKATYLQRLKDYSSSQYGFEIRENAFLYISQLALWDSYTLKNLLEATVHPAWRFAKMAREILKGLVDDPQYLHKLKEIAPEVSQAAENYLQSTLNK